MAQVSHTSGGTSSPLLKGPSIFEQLQNSHFREFYSAIYKVRTYPPEADFLTLPQLVVIGTSNAGKSSLLENITKCAIFPRDKKPCTKFPLRLRIQQVSDPKECGVTITHDGIEVPLASSEDALKVITKIMDEEERLDDLTGQELLVVIKQASALSCRPRLADAGHVLRRVESLLNIQEPLVLLSWYYCISQSMVRVWSTQQDHLLAGCLTSTVSTPAKHMLVFQLAPDQRLSLCMYILFDVS